MSSIRRPLSGPTLAFALADETRIIHDQLASGPGGRTARTLVKSGPLRLTLMGLSAGGEIAQHSADGPITVLVLDGTIDFRAEGRTWPLAAGSLMVLEAGVPHGISSSGGATFLLTVAGLAGGGRDVPG